ncbi:hypothetical protein D3C80_1439530 [compost metagenome]
MELYDAGDEHIGIWNARQRLELLYGGAARMAFSRAEPQGAAVDIWLPVSEKKEGLVHP